MLWKQNNPKSQKLFCLFSPEVSPQQQTSCFSPLSQRLLKGSVQLQERFSQLQVKGDLLDSVFGPDRYDGLQGELSSAVRNRELLHAQLMQRKSRLQVPE